MNFTCGMICGHIMALLIIYKLPDARSFGLCIESDAFIPVLGRSLASWLSNQIVSVMIH